MDFSRFDSVPALAAFRDEVIAFLDAELTDDVIAEAEAQRDEHHPAFFRGLGDRGWLIPTATADEGGADLSYEQVEILDAELTRHRAPVINQSTSRMIFPAVRDYAHESIRDAVIHEVTSGSTALTLGYSEPDGGSDIAEVKTRAVRQPDGDWLINGAKVYTTGAHHARYIFLLANTDPQAKKGAGLTMFLLPVDLPGVEVHPIETLGERTNTVFFGDVRLDDAYRLGEIDGGWAVLQGPLETEHGIGVTRRGRASQDLGVLYARRLALALEDGLDWVDEHPGRRDDPVVHSTIGEVLLGVESALSTDRLEGRINGAQGFQDGTSLLLALAAPESLMVADSPAGRILAAHLGSQVSTIYGGTVEVFKNLVARQMGLPRPAYRQ
jgi:alkylation response protein AidB-like acyl-CoA dehydrogenase